MCVPICCIFILVLKYTNNIFFECSFISYALIGKNDMLINDNCSDTLKAFQYPGCIGKQQCSINPSSVVLNSSPCSGGYGVLVLDLKMLNTMN